MKAFPLFIFLLATVGAQSQQTSEVIGETIDEDFAEYGSETPGLAIGIVREGELILRRAYGTANLEYDAPIDPATTVFALASVSKQFTVFALMLLAEEGKLALEDDVHKYLPELPDYGYPITLRHLASNTSGVRSDLHLLGMSGISPSDHISQEMVHEMIFRQRELNFPPGERFRYSNSGFALLAEVVARVAKKPFPEFMHDRVFQPLGMENTFVMDDCLRPVDQLATSYAPQGQGAGYAKQIMNYSFYGASGIFTTLDDFAKWAANFSELRVGSERIFTEMNTPATLNSGDSSGYGLGQFVNSHRGILQVQHGGGSAGYRSYIGRFPDRKLAVILLSNNGRLNPEVTALGVADLFLDPDTSTEERNLAATEPISPYQPPTRKLDAVTGRYLEVNDFYVRDIQLRNDTLFYLREEQGGRESALLPLAPDTFLLAGSDLRVVFTTGNGEQGMHILQGRNRTGRFTGLKTQNPTSAQLKELTGLYYSEELDTYYLLETVQGILQAHHPRIGNVALRPVSSTGFLSDAWQFRYLKFELDAQGDVTGFRISSDRAQGVWFARRD